MGPGRQGEVYGIVALVPDGRPGRADLVGAILTGIEQMNEDPLLKQSWVSEGDLGKMLQTFLEFPSWIKNIFRCVCFVWAISKHY
jgi:salicylate hydroxylase